MVYSVRLFFGRVTFGDRVKIVFWSILCEVVFFVRRMGEK